MLVVSVFHDDIKPLTLQDSLQKEQEAGWSALNDFVTTFAFQDAEGYWCPLVPGVFADAEIGYLVFHGYAEKAWEVRNSYGSRPLNLSFEWKQER